MVQTSCVCIALAFLPGSFVLGNTITKVEVDGSVSGFGDASLRCFGPQPGCFEQPPGMFRQFEFFNFSGANTQLGSFVASVQPLTAIEVFGFQSVTTTGDSLSIDLSSGWRGLNPPSGTIATTFHVSVNNGISVAFDLTVESLLQLDGGGGTGIHLFDSHGNSVPLTFTFCCGLSALLQPGTYQFVASVPITGTGLFLLPNQGSFSGFSLDANFTSIPEPRFTWILLTAVPLGWIINRAVEISRWRVPCAGKTQG